MHGGYDAAVLRQELARYRDQLIVEHRRANLSRPPDPVVAATRPVEVPVALEFLSRLAGFAAGAGDDVLDKPIDLPADLAAEIRATSTAPENPQPPTFRGASERRAQLALANVARCVIALSVNDLSVADRRLRELSDATGITIGPEMLDVARREMLLTMIDVHQQIAELERRHPARPDRDSDCRECTGSKRPASSETLPPVVSSGHAEATPASEAEPAPAVTITKAMNDFIARSRASAREPVSAKVLRDRETARDLFRDLVGDVAVTDIDDETVGRLVEDLLRLPAKHGRGIYAGLSARDAIQRADEHDVEADVAAPRDTREKKKLLTERLSRATVNKHLSSLEGGIAPLMNLRPGERSVFLRARFSKLEVKKRPAFKRRAPSDDLLAQIFQGPRFTGHAGDTLRASPGELLTLDARYWVPLIALHSAGCLEEILQLRPDDVHSREEILVFDYGADGAAVKTNSRPRVVPVHHQLKRLGFLEYVARMRREGSYLLFPGFSPRGPDERLGHGFTQDWTQYRKRTGTYVRGQDMHAFRHSVNTKLLNAGVPEAIIKHVLGHAQQGMTGDTYNSGIGLRAAARAIARLSYDCIDWTQLEAASARARATWSA